MRNVASTSFASVAVGAHVLDLPHHIVAGYASDSDSSNDAICVGALVGFFGEVVLVVLGAGCQAALESNPGATVPNVLVWWAVLINLPYCLSWLGSFLAVNK